MFIPAIWVVKYWRGQGGRGKGGCGMPGRVLGRVLVLALVAVCASAQSVGELAHGFLRDLIRLDTSNPPGNETRVANYLKQVADREGIPAELVGENPARLNFIARLKGSGGQRPLLMIAHSDVVPVDRSQWTVDPFAAVEKDGYIYGRGAEDDKNLLAAELAVMVDLARRKVRLERDLILFSEADEEAGSAGAHWVIDHAWGKIDAEFALNEYSYILPAQGGVPVFQIQTAEKVPTRLKLTARGTAGHGSLPRDDNPVYHLARAIVRLTEAEQPVQLNATTRAYFRELSKLPDYAWVGPLLPLLEDPKTAGAAADAMRKTEPEFGAMLRLSVSPTMLAAGMKINVIPNTAEAYLDARRLPGESAQEVFGRLRRMVDDSAVTVEAAETGSQPSTEPSSLTSPLYKAMESVFREADPKAVVVPFLMRGTTDGAYLRAKGMAVYGVPVFRKDGELRLHGNDERIGVENLRAGTELLEKIVLKVSQ
jgi:acetylornithine deacetylase/succinyl-diaminopimelate desuccinylase-like protein